jgi:hypothetical protein
MIYVQSNKERTLPHHFDCSCALFGAVDSALDWKFAPFEDLVSGKYDLLIKNNLFVGSVEFMREVFKRVGITSVSLPANSNRPSEMITLESAYKRVAKGEKIFIKPVQTKLFTGLVLDGCTYSCLDNLPPETIVWAYDVFNSNIESEWRVYIHKNLIIDSRNYSGDITISPDYNYVKKVISENRNQFPCAYTIDVGIFHSGDNVVVEFNDMWAIGNYGMPNDIYLKLLQDRYFEIIEKS